jgi:hypothetical protein
MKADRQAAAVAGFSAVPASVCAGFGRFASRFGNESAGDVEDGVRVPRSFAQLLNGVSGRKDYQLEIAASCLLLDIIHDREIALSTRADHKPTALPRDFLCDRQRRMPVGIAEFLRRLLLPLPDFPVVDDHIMFVRHSIDDDPAKREILDMHDYLSQIIRLQTLEGLGRATRFRRHGPAIAKIHVTEPTAREATLGITLMARALA